MGGDSSQDLGLETPPASSRPASADLVVWEEFWGFPKIGGPQCRPQYTIILIIGTPKIVPIILGNPHLGVSRRGSTGVRIKVF